MKQKGIMQRKFRLMIPSSFSIPVYFKASSLR